MVVSVGRPFPGPGWWHLSPEETRRYQGCSAQRPQDMVHVGVQGGDKEVGAGPSEHRGADGGFRGCRVLGLTSSVPGPVPSSSGSHPPFFS